MDAGCPPRTNFLKLPSSVSAPAWMPGRWSRAASWQAVFVNRGLDYHFLCNFVLFGGLLPPCGTTTPHGVFHVPLSIQTFYAALSAIRGERLVIRMADKLGRTRTRNYATVVYPESAPENWQELLGEQCVPAFISPLHDQDINPTGEPKKPHYHVILMFDSVKTEEQAKEVFTLIGGVGCEPVKSLRAYARYLCHLDNPEKVQYDTSLVRQFGGADYMDLIGMSVDRYIALADILDYIDENQIVDFTVLMRYCREEKFEWFKVLVDGGVYTVKEYMKTLAWYLRK